MAEAKRTVNGAKAQSHGEDAVEIESRLSVRQFAEVMGVEPVNVIKQLMRRGIMANINQIIDFEVATALADEMGCKVVLKRRAGKKAEAKKQAAAKGEGGGKSLPRPPVVTIMGHVNHGKTKLLDAIREANVVDTEAGGITQHIGAYQVEVSGKKITFLDTPGHEAFTAMRARGAQVTDIVILVVAADDGVMPQTREAIDHARAAGVPIMVAINKIDKPGVNPDVVKQQLADAGLMVEEWGGDVITAAVSAKERMGISELLESLLLVAEMEELTGDPTQSATGVVIEAELDKTKGPLATFLMQAGTLKVGDIVVVGTTWGRIKAMFNDKGKRVRKSELAAPVKILGLAAVPQVGDVLSVAASERHAQALSEQRSQEKRQESQAVSLGNLYDQISAGKVKELNLVLKTDVQGSLEPIKTSLEQLGDGEVKVRVVHSDTGNVTKSDVMLAAASKGIVISFGTGSEPGAQRLAEVEGVSIRSYKVIYELVDDVEKALKGLLEPVFVEVVEGRAEVRAVFSAGKKVKVAGAFIAEGKARAGSQIRVWRGKECVCESVVGSLRRFKDNVREVASGYECGVGVEGFNNFEVGDILEFFKQEQK